VRFRIVQRIAAPVDAVAAAFVDPAFIDRLATLPKLGNPALLAQDRQGDTVRQQVRYRFAGELSSAVLLVIDPERLTWVEDATVDLARHVTDVRIIPDHYGDRLKASMHITAVAGPTPDTTVRTAEGDIRVPMPLVGGKVERAIVSGMEEQAELQARLVEDFVALDG
jgi:hypothetical protein